MPQAEVVAITGSSIINHTIDMILPCIRREVLVVDVQQVIASVTAGDSFQKIQGLQRVSMLRCETSACDLQNNFSGTSRS